MNYFLNRAKELEQELIAMRRELTAMRNWALTCPRRTPSSLKSCAPTATSPKLWQSRCHLHRGQGGKSPPAAGRYGRPAHARGTGMPYAAQNGHCHSCGHDCHTAAF